MSHRVTVLRAVPSVALTLFCVHCGDAASAGESGSTDERVSSATTGPIHPKASSSLCLDVVGQGTANGTAVQVWSCSGNANQQWTYDGTSLRVYGTKCLDMTNGSTTNGARLQIWDCVAGSANQSWTQSGSTLQWTGKGKCLDLTNGVVASGTPIQSWSCSAGNVNQEWVFESSTSTGADAGTTPPPDSSAPMDSGSSSSKRVVAYLPNYSGSYATWAQTIDFTKMTHLNLAFATATTSNGWDMGASDSDVAALVHAAHAAGVKVLASLGGGGGDQTVIAQFKNASNVPALVSSLDSFVATHDFDGVDVDIEDPSHLGADYTTFVDAVVTKMHPEGKLVTAAVAQYLQDSMQDSTLHAFDFVNVMIYSTYADSVSAMTYYKNTKSVPAALITLGAGFFGQDSAGNEYAYSDILAADSNAWNYDQTQVNGKTVTYTGAATMKTLADYAHGYGGIMFWELSEDSTGTHSLYKVIQGEN